MPLTDYDDIQAEENRRREVAVKAGASPRATKYEDSPLKRMIQKDVEARITPVADEFAEYKKNTPLPGYNFVSTSTAFLTAEEVVEKNKAAAEASKEDAENNKNLQKEARANEMKITRTSTGQPKVLHGEEVEPLQGRADEDKGITDTPKLAVTKSPQIANPSPIGSGDARASVAPKDNK